MPGKWRPAIAVVEAQVLKESVIPDGAGGFTTPNLVTATSVDPATALPVAPLVYRHTPAVDEKFPINGIYAVQVLASALSEGQIVQTTISVYPLNSALKASIALAESDVLQMKILSDPVTGDKILPDTVAAISGDTVTSAPLSANILVASVVIPNWPTAETVDRGGGGLPSAGALGLQINFVEVPNDGTHGDGDVAGLNPPAGSTVPVGSLVTVSVYARTA